MKRKHTEADPARALRDAALRYPEAREGIACEGTSAEKRTIKARDKAFLFLGAADAMLKLRDSLAEARGLAAEQPGRCKVGGPGWVTLTFRGVEPLPDGLLLRWLDESYRLVAPKQLVASLPPGGKPAGKATAATKSMLPANSKSPAKPKPTAKPKPPAKRASKR